MAKAESKDPFRFWGNNAKKAGYTVIPNMLIRHMNGLNLSPQEFTVLIFLLTYRNLETHEASPSKTTIGESLDMHPDTVRRHIKSLKAKGYITVKHRPREKNRHATNIYQFQGLADALAERSAAHLAMRNASNRHDRRTAEKLRTSSTEQLKVDEQQKASLTVEGANEIDRIRGDQ